jgi:glutamine synthetase
MDTTTREVLEFVKENDVKFIRLGFCDLLGFQKNISIMAEDLPAAFENGITFDAYAIKGVRDITQSDLFLFPDPATLTLLPWRPGPGRTARFFCDIKNPNGTPFAMDSRGILKKVIGEYAKMGLVCTVGAECEFYLFKTDEDGAPTFTPVDKGGYLDIAPLDKSEDIRREICLVIEEMGIRPETSHHEQGPGQNEIDFKFSDALTCADNFLAFKTTVRKIAARNGLFASFLPKPIPDAAGSGLHVNLSLSRKGQNVFANDTGEFSKTAENFIAGILSKTPEITLFLNPTSNSYKRFGEYEAPKYVSWSHQNRSQLIRIPAAKGEKVRMELRSPDPSLNPYLAFALILAAGLEGIENETPLPPAQDADLYTAADSITSKLQALPKNLTEAINLAKSSEFVKHITGTELLLKYTAIKESETDLKKEDYFDTI